MQMTIGALIGLLGLHIAYNRWPYVKEMMTDVLILNAWFWILVALTVCAYNIK